MGFWLQMANFVLAQSFHGEDPNFDPGKVAIEGDLAVLGAFGDDEQHRGAVCRNAPHLAPPHQTSDTKSTKSSKLKRQPQ